MLCTGVELKKPDANYMSIDLKPAAFNKAAADSKTSGHFEMLLNNWCDQVEQLLDQSDNDASGAHRKATEDVGPDTELEYWRNRMAKFNSITEQLKCTECKLVLGVTMAGRTQAHRNWKAIDMVRVRLKTTLPASVFCRGVAAGRGTAAGPSTGTVGARLPHRAACIERWFPLP